MFEPYDQSDFAGLRNWRRKEGNWIGFAWVKCRLWWVPLPLVFLIRITNWHGAVDFSVLGGEMGPCAKYRGNSAREICLRSRCFEPSAFVENWFNGFFFF